ncbi:diacylglycerol kinase family protein [Alteromonadaceae bacterium BrNp21-10]|nr:diacylglycerol kinase family protein [Alteromonadaceae bacterium BrNp21-10]
MYIGYYYFIAACLTFTATAYSPSIYLSVVLWWIGASLLAVSAAYYFSSPQIFRKKANGTIPAYIRWIFIPFLLGVQLYNVWARKNDTVPAIQKIEKNLYLACRLFPSDLGQLKNDGVTAILDVTAEFDGLDWSAANENLHYLNIPVLDHQSPSISDLVRAINWISSHVNNHQGVVVHCALGRGRSVLITAAYLLSKNPDLSVTKVLQVIQKFRKTAKLNKRQLKSLEKAHESGLLKVGDAMALIANPVSGGGKWSQYKHDIFSRLSVNFVLKIYETSEDISAEVLAKQAINDGHRILVGCGGDGTIREVASVVVDSNCKLGVIPLGTTNALSHVLHGSITKVLPVETCCDVILLGKTKKMDIARCNNELVLLCVSLGYGQKMIELSGRGEKDQHGQFAYLKGFQEAIQLDEPLLLRVKIDDADETELEALSFVIANAAPFTSILAQGGAEPSFTDGLLDITCLPANKSSTEKLLNLTDLTIAGLTQRESNEGVYFNQAESVTLSADNTFKYVIDGENRQADKIEVKINKSVLNVFV